MYLCIMFPRLAKNLLYHSIGRIGTRCPLSNTYQDLIPIFSTIAISFRNKNIRIHTSVSRYLVLDFQVRTFPEHRQRVLDTMIRLNREYRPSLVFVPSATDTHQDHKTVADEGFRAFKRTTILAYELSWNTLEFSNRCFVTLEEEDIQKKIAALYEYNSQQACRTYVNEAYVRALALVRDTQIQKPLAEVFDVPRLILD